ncbi:hypothetical protein LCGC14_2651150 [marine sediment metagenome]|uniref:Uncharacterized protein n=1 Tax=marine sediment metagenome TaxID=412755 RepID=A0A0F9AH25_9ZZZZ
MGWRTDNKYWYTLNTLWNIHKAYGHIYQCIEWRTRKGWIYGITTHPLSLIEYKADFDNAVEGTGQTRSEFLDYRLMRDYLNGVENE